jgi:hypothetical protein
LSGGRKTVQEEKAKKEKKEEGKEALFQKEKKGKKNLEKETGRKEERERKVTIKEAVLGNFIVGLLAASIYLPIELTGVDIIPGEEYYSHVLLTTICFVVMPIGYLIGYGMLTKKKHRLFLTTKKGMKGKKIISSLMQGILMHAGLFYPWVVLTQKFCPTVEKLCYWFNDPGEGAIYLVIVAVNVIMFEYYSKAFVQLQFMEGTGKIELLGGKITLQGGKKMGLGLQIAAWLIGHIQELLWLQKYLGWGNAAAFIIVSGVLTGITVMETENILGVTVGHILLNVLLVVTFSI